MHIVQLLLKCNELNTSIYGLTTPIIISVKVDNFECTKLMVDHLGGIEKALQQAEDNHLTDLAQHLQGYAQAYPQVNAQYVYLYSQSIILITRLDTVKNHQELNQW